MTVRQKLASSKNKVVGKKQQAAEGTALTIATGVLMFALEAARSGEYYVGAVGVVVSGAVFMSYAIFNEKGQRSKIDELVDTIGEDTLEELVNVTADELREALNNVQDSDDGNSGS